MNAQVRGRVIKELEARGTTRVAVAKEIDTTQSAVSHMLTGNTGKIPESWDKLLTACGLKLVAVPIDTPDDKLP